MSSIAGLEFLIADIGLFRHLISCIEHNCCFLYETWHTGSTLPFMVWGGKTDCASEEVVMPLR